MVGKVIGLGIVGVGGWLAWKQLAQPYLAQRALEAEARAVAARTPGMTFEQGLAQVARAACKLGVRASGVPANPLSDAACNLSGTLQAKLIVQGVPLAIKGLKAGTKSAVVVGKMAVLAPVSGAKSAAKTTVNVAKKLKFWGLEGLHC